MDYIQPAGGNERPRQGKGEGADFTENELEAAFGSTVDASRLITRSQRQARAARETYQWIAGLADDLPISDSLIKEVHRRIVTGRDEDHCAPGHLRRADQNVTFGYPRQRGAEGGILVSGRSSRW